MEKACSKCGKTQDTAFFNRDRTKKDGLFSSCKTCSRATCRETYRRYEDKHREIKQRWKAENQERHAEINKQWRSENKDRVCAATNRWRSANPETARRWAENNPEAVREIDRRWKAANQDKMREREKAYAAANPHKMRAKNARRRAGLLRATPHWVDHEIMELIYSECPPGYHVDHFYPLKGHNSCGLHVPWNLQYLSASENCKKSNKAPVEREAWYNL